MSSRRRWTPRRLGAQAFESARVGHARVRVCGYRAEHGGATSARRARK